MKRLLVIFTCCSPLVLSPAISFALDSPIATAAEISVYKKYGPIHYYESLWSVSKKLRPNSSVSIQQTLVAIYKLNPDVFFAGDINHLLENSVINVPTDTFIKKQSNQDAINLINKYSDKSKNPTSSVVAAKKTDPLITKSPSLSEQQAVDVGEQSLTASLIDKKYLPDPNSSVSPDPATESDNEQQNQSTDNVKNTVSADADSQSLIKILALQSELNLVNEQLAATKKVNQQFKSKLQMLIDEIDLLKNKIEGESADQLRLLTLLEEYKPEPSSAQQPVINNDQVNEQKGSWITGSLSNLLLVAGSALLLITFIFSLIFRRRTKRLLDEKTNRISGLGASYVSLRSETSDVQKVDKLNLALQNASNIKPGSLPGTVKDKNSSNSEMPRDSLNNDLMTQAEPLVTLKVDQSISLASGSIKSETPFDDGQDDKQDEVDKLPALDENDELTAVNTFAANLSAPEKDQSSTRDLSENKAVIEIFNADQPFDAASLNYSYQLQEGVGQTKKNLKSIPVPVEKEQFTGTINLKNTEKYIDIETLLKNSERDNPDDHYSEFDFYFDLGLDEFPDMLGENTAIDIDDDEYGISARLDLARAYLEIDDKIGAKKILMASIENSNVEQRLEIDKLLTLL